MPNIPQSVVVCGNRGCICDNILCFGDFRKTFNSLIRLLMEISPIVVRQPRSLEVEKKGRLKSK